MSPLRSFSAGIITTLIIVGSLSYWYLPYLGVPQSIPLVPFTQSSSSSQSVSGVLSPVYVAQPFATPLSTDCSAYGIDQRGVCEMDLANTIYSQFVTLTPPEQLTYDCSRLKTEYQQVYCQNRKESIPQEQRKSEILDRARSIGIVACSEFSSGTDQDRCSLDVALGRLTRIVSYTGDTQTGNLSESGGLILGTPLVPHCDILDGDLRVRCEQEVERMLSSEKSILPTQF